MIRKHIIVHGRVQGVGFRYIASSIAAGCHVTGWVRNQYDGTVEIEVQGAMKIKEQYPNAVLLFVTAPSIGELKARLEGRGTEEAAVIEKRMRRAAEEAESISCYEYLVCNEDGQL